MVAAAEKYQRRCSYLIPRENTSYRVKTIDRPCILVIQVGIILLVSGGRRQNAVGIFFCCSCLYCSLPTSTPGQKKTIPIGGEVKRFNLSANHTKKALSLRHARLRKNKTALAERFGWR